eukprot:15072637-Alexandrium_andersonii.AAC.1
MHQNRLSELGCAHRAGHQTMQKPSNNIPGLPPPSVTRESSKLACGIAHHPAALATVPTIDREGGDQGARGRKGLHR